MSRIGSGIPTDSTRARFRRIMRFQSVDRIPNCELGAWPQTLQRWYAEGMARRLSRGGFWNGEPYFGLEPLYTGVDGVDTGPIPRFKEEVFEETDRYIVARRPDGIVTKALKTGYMNGQRLSMDQYLDWPVKSRVEFQTIWKLTCTTLEKILLTGRVP